LMSHRCCRRSIGGGIRSARTNTLPSRAVSFGGRWRIVVSAAKREENMQAIKTPSAIQPRA
jgi:hypothetical protein